MTHTTPSNGSNLKDTIKEDRFSGITDLAKRKALVNAYNQVAEYAGAAFGTLKGESLVDAIHDLYGGEEYSDNMWDYRYNIGLLTKLLAMPSVNAGLVKHADEYKVVTILHMLERLTFFFKRMDKPMYRALLLLHDLDSYPSQYDESRLYGLVEEFRERTGLVRNNILRDVY